MLAASDPTASRWGGKGTRPCAVGRWCRVRSPSSSPFAGDSLSRRPVKQRSLRRHSHCTRAEDPGVGPPAGLRCPFAKAAAAVPPLQGEVGGGTPCRCPGHERGTGGHGCAIALVDDREYAISLGAWTANDIAQPRYAVRPCHAVSAGNRDPPDTGHSLRDRLGRTLRVGLLPRTAATRASVSAPLPPCFSRFPACTATP